MRCACGKPPRSERSLYEARHTPVTSRTGFRAGRDGSFTRLQTVGAGGVLGQIGIAAI